MTIFLSTIMSCKESSAKKITNVSVNNKKDSVGKKLINSEIIEVGFPENFEKLPKLKFDSISEAEFAKYTKTQFLSFPKLEQKGDYYNITTTKSKHTLKKYKDYGGEESWSGNEFLGYFTNLKMFAFRENSTAESLGFSELYLLDDITDHQYKVVSWGDSAMELPIPSKTGKFLVSYYNSVYEHKNCDIVVFKIGEKSNPKNYLQEFASYHSDDFAVDEIVWISDNSFYVKGYQETYENEDLVKKIKYYKTSF